MNKTDFQSLPTRLGVYNLTRHIGTRAGANLYFATQSHVERGVVVEVLPPGSEHAAVETFLASARSRVSVSLPHVTQVFESMVSDDIWYMTQERPEGRNIGRIAKEKNGLTATQVCYIIESAAAMYREAAAQNVAAGGLALHDIYMSADDCVSFLSPVFAGEHSPELLSVQQQSLAAVLQPLLPHDGSPGQSRIATLTDWLANGYEADRLGWDALADTAALVREQLAPQLRREHVAGLSGVTRGAVVRETKRKRRKLIKTLWVVGVGVTLVIIAAVAGAMSAPDVPEALPANDGNTVLCRIDQDAVEVDVRPVTIREYREFLLAFESETKLNRDERRVLLEDVPSDGSTRRPAHWENQWAAATKGKVFKGEKLSLDSPVRGVSYWDALVYSRYRQAQLPSARLLAAVRANGGVECSVCEWTTDMAPESEIYQSGSILLPADASAAPVLEPDRSARKLPYGFRLVYPR